MWNNYKWQIEPVQNAFYTTKICNKKQTSNEIHVPCSSSGCGGKTSPPKPARKTRFRSQDRMVRGIFCFFNRSFFMISASDQRRTADPEGSHRPPAHPQTISKYCPCSSLPFLTWQTGCATISKNPVSFGGYYEHSAISGRP